MPRITIFVDSITPDKAAAVTKDQASTIYNIHTLNAIRNNKLKDPIPISEESPLIQAGVYVCLKIANPADSTMTLMFFDFTKNDSNYKEIKDNLSDRYKYILDLIANHISENYDSLKDEIILTKGRAVATDSKIKVSFSNPALSKNPKHKYIMDRFSEWVNQVLDNIRYDMIRNDVIIEYQEDKDNPNGFAIGVITDKPELRVKALDAFNNAIKNGGIG